MSPIFFTEPFDSLADFDRLFDDLFNGRAAPGDITNLSDARQHQSTAWRLIRSIMNLHEAREQNLVTATFELPGHFRENVQLDVKENVPTVLGESTILSGNGYVITS